MAYQKEHLCINNSTEWLLNAHKPFLLEPNLTFLFLINPSIAYERIKNRKPHVFENIKFLKKVQDNYMDIARDKKNRVVIINAEKGKEEIMKDCLHILSDKGII